MNFTLKIWRQKSSDVKGRFETYALNDISEDISFLEMLDTLNEQLMNEGVDPVAFDHDCREGICGMCSLIINGAAHGPQRKTTTCQLHMRHFKDGETITIEPFRAKPFRVIKDLIVDRTSLDTIIQSGGYVSVNTGVTTDANTIPVQREIAEKAMDAAACIGCGACAAACPNASAMLFVAAKISHLNLLPQGKPEKDHRTLNMTQAMEAAGFGNCTNTGECQAVCPKNVSLDFIAKMNRDYAIASAKKFFGL